jgi:hypothetical protein
MPFALAAAAKSSILATGFFGFGLSISFAGFFRVLMIGRQSSQVVRGFPFRMYSNSLPHSSQIAVMVKAFRSLLRLCDSRQDACEHFGQYFAWPA